MLFRSLQIWDASGLVTAAIPPRRTPAGGYTERRYTPIEVFELLVLADLRVRGFTVHQLHVLVRALGDHFKTGIYESTGGGGPVTLLTDGRDLYARTEQGEFYNILKAPTQPLLVVGAGGANGGEDGLSLRALSGAVRKRRTARRTRRRPTGA